MTDRTNDQPGARHAEGEYGDRLAANGSRAPSDDRDRLARVATAHECREQHDEADEHQKNRLAGSETHA